MDVPSPTFTLVQITSSVCRFPISTFIAGDASEIDELGLEEAVDDGS